ncbi:hypothetical protein BH23GEM10_BH23GEM10_15940 [soil metagenome]
MNRIRAYFDRIQGRLVAALALGALGMLIIYFVSARALTTFTESMGDELTLLQDRISLAMQLENAILGQIDAAEGYLVTRDTSSLTTSIRLAAEAQSAHNRMYSSADVNSRAFEQLTVIRRSHTETIQATSTALAEHLAGDEASAEQRIRSLGPALRQLRQQILQLTLFELRGVEERAIEFALASERQKGLLRLILLVSLIVAAALGYYTLQAIERPLNRLVVAANQFGGGDLNVAINGNMPDEFRVLAGAFTGMADRFRMVVGETVRTANKVGQSAADLSSI